MMRALANGPAFRITRALSGRPAGHAAAALNAPGVVWSADQEKKERKMPKMKTKKSAAKRFRVRPGGTVKRGQAFKRHILTKKTTKNKRQLRGAVTCLLYTSPSPRDRG